VDLKPNMVELHQKGANVQPVKIKLLSYEMNQQVSQLLRSHIRVDAECSESQTGTV
jgi:hypothetical protein